MHGEGNGACLRMGSQPPVAELLGGVGRTIGLLLSSPGIEYSLVSTERGGNRTCGTSGCIRIWEAFSVMDMCSKRLQQGLHSHTNLLKITELYT